MVLRPKNIDSNVNRDRSIMRTLVMCAVSFSVKCQYECIRDKDHGSSKRESNLSLEKKYLVAVIKKATSNAHLAKCLDVVVRYTQN